MKKKIKFLKKYDDGKIYLPEYEYDLVVTPQGVTGQKHKRITNEEDWQNYWGNVGAGYVNRAQNAAAPVVAGVLGAAAALPTAALGASALGGLGGLSRILPAAKTITGELAAAELAGMGWNQAYKSMSGKDWSTGVADVIESATGWRPSEEVASMTNPGYFMGGVAKKGVEATIDAAKGLDNALWNGIQMANGRWVNIGGREFRLDPNTAGINGRPFRMRRPRVGQRPITTAEPELNPNAVFGFSREGEPVGLNNATATNTQAATNRFRAATIGERPSVIATPGESPRVINPIRGTLEVRANVADVNNTNILQNADDLNQSLQEGGERFSNTLDELAGELGVNRRYIEDYARNRGYDLHSSEGRSSLLRDSGYRLLSNGGTRYIDRPQHGNELVYNIIEKRKAFYDSNPEKVKSMYESIANELGLNSEELKAILKSATNWQKTLDWANFGSLPNIFSNYKNEQDAIRGFFENVENLQAVAESGKDISKYINKDLSGFFNKFGISDSRIQDLIERGYFTGRYFNSLSNILKELQELQQNGKDLKKLLGEDPKFSTQVGLEWSPEDIAFWQQRFRLGNTLHRNLPRPATLDKLSMETPDVLAEHPEYIIDDEGLVVDDKGNYVKSPREMAYMNSKLRDVWTDMKNANDFSVLEKLGWDFSADSSPFMAKSARKLSALRAKQGRFPGMIKLDPNRNYNTPYTETGNNYASVNLGTVENPYIGGVYGYNPTVGEMRKFPNRKQAVTNINNELAQMYLELIKNSQGIPGMPDYGIDPEMLKAVIDAGGDIDKVPGAWFSTFKNSDIPLWATFPENSDAPIYPSFSWIFDAGKSIRIKPANKGKFNATKKRTGKTTEQLAHSKNPLTRKRAIFALNARKWKH